MVFVAHVVNCDIPLVATRGSTCYDIVTYERYLTYTLGTSPLVLISSAATQKVPRYLSPVYAPFQAPGRKEWEWDW